MSLNIPLYSLEKWTCTGTLSKPKIENVMSIFIFKTFIKFTVHQFLAYSQRYTTITTITPKTFSSSPQSLLLIGNYFLFPPPRSWQTLIYCLYGFTHPRNFLSVESKYVAFCIWFLSLSRVFLRFFHVTA